MVAGGVGGLAKGGNLEGRCRCGHVSYRIGWTTLPAAYACHCTDCQTWSGSAFSEQVIVPEAAFELAGEVGDFKLVGASGNVSHQRACPRCFTRLFNTNTGRLGSVIVRAGTLDRSSELRCVAHIWTRSKQPAIQIPAGTATWPRSAPPGVLDALLNDAGVDRGRVEISR